MLDKLVYEVQMSKSILDYFGSKLKSQEVKKSVSERVFNTLSALYN